LSAAASPQTLLGGLTALSRPPAVFRGPVSKERGGEGKGRRGREFIKSAPVVFAEPSLDR